MVALNFIASGALTLQFGKEKWHTAMSESDLKSSESIPFYLDFLFCFLWHLTLKKISFYLKVWAHMHVH